MKKSEFPFEGKIVLVTGAGKGIGEATARLFFEQGARVALLARTARDLMRVAESMEEETSGDRVMVCPADVSDVEQVKKVFHRIRSTWGPVGILINNAGALVNRSVLGTSDRDWARILGVNLSGSFYCSKEAFAHMGELGGGNIINVASLAGIRGAQKFPGLSAYVAAKTGLVGLTEAMAVEGKELGIRVNAVAPGAVDTGMLKEAGIDVKTSTLPMDIARVIVGLCDDQQFRVMNGAVVEVLTNE